MDSIGRDQFLECMEEKFNVVNEIGDFYLAGWLRLWRLRWRWCKLLLIPMWVRWLASDGGCAMTV